MFTKALPIWLAGKEKEKNVQAKFVSDFIGKENTKLKITGATYYKVFLNGKLIHYGPSPTSRGYARVDIVSLDAAIKGNNTIIIEAAGYNCFSYAAVKQTSFIQAEVFCDNQCIVATGFDFDGYYVPSRIKNTMRYSFQRQFTEVWNLSKKDVREPIKVLELDLKYLERRAPLPDMEVEKIDHVYTKDKFFCVDNNWSLPSLQGAIDNICDIIDGFELCDIEERPIKEFSDFDYKISENTANLPCRVSKGEYAVFECKNNTCGLMNLKYSASDNCKVIIAFDEKLKDGKFDYKRWETLNVIGLYSGAQNEFTNFDVYGFKYFAVFVVEGVMDIELVNVIKVRNPIKNPPVLKCEDELILKIYQAACESARCNTLGIFMDCPTRERAGWLCDSYFAAQALNVLDRNTSVEDDFVENFANARCEELPKGMLPMCYPADHANGNYIPQWSLWFLMQLDQYKDRNKSVSIDKYKDLVYNVLGYFGLYENEYGFLENLGGWNFVEWSKANDWTGGINFPTNMLYSEALKIAGTWFSDKNLLDKSKRLKEKIVEFSFDGKFFKDQALRNDDNVPVCCEHISEVCQYYAFMFNVADKEQFNDLYKTLVTQFAPGSDYFINVEKVNAFMGMYMRMELLMKWGFEEQLVEEIKAFFGSMADITGTLWEHKNITNSLNHGFTSYMTLLLLKIYNK